MAISLVASTGILLIVPQAISFIQGGLPAAFYFMVLPGGIAVCGNESSGSGFNVDCER